MDSVANYGQEIGQNLEKITKKLLKNQNLCKLLVNTDLDPLNKDLHQDIEDTMELYGIYIRNVPLVFLEGEETTETKIILIFDESQVDGSNPNNEFLSLLIYIYCPYIEWLIAGNQLRPFAIMSEIRKSIQDKCINGLGTIQYLGFEIASLTPQMGSYRMRFGINAFNK